MSKIFRAFRFDQSGATSIEYGLIACFIGLLIIAGATAIGQELIVPFQNMSAGLSR